MTEPWTDDEHTGSGKSSGKVILLGEHAVVYGVPAIAVSLSQGATARARFSARDRICLGGEVLPNEDPIYRALDALRSALGAPPAELDLRLEIPAGSGLGASAALGVAAARALAQCSPEELSARRVEGAADAWENVFHGNASGVDRAAAAGRGVIRFTRGHEPQPISVRHDVHLVVAVAGPPASTQEMVSGVARLRASNRPQFDKNLAAISTLVDNAVVCLRSGDLPSLGKLMDLCHMILSGWMLSTESLEIACKTARQAGALGAKLTGSGGGGCMVALAADDAMSARVAQALAALGHPTFSTTISGSCEHDHPHHHDS